MPGENLQTCAAGGTHFDRACGLSQGRERFEQQALGNFHLRWKRGGRELLENGHRRNDWEAVKRGACAWHMVLMFSFDCVMWFIVADSVSVRRIRSGLPDIGQRIFHAGERETAKPQDA